MRKQQAVVFSMILWCSTGLLVLSQSTAEAWGKENKQPAKILGINSPLGIMQGYSGISADLNPTIYLFLCPFYEG